MSKLLENKQMLHIGAEIVSLVGVVYYFSRKNTELLKHIEEITQRLDEQEEIIAKQDQVIKAIIAKMNGYAAPQTSAHQGTREQATSRPSQKKQQKQVAKTDDAVVPTTTTTSSFAFVIPAQSSSATSKIARVQEVQEDDDDGDLDDELTEELAELQNAHLKNE